MSDSAIRRITLLSFRTFGDYVLKVPFLFELERLYPNAEVTIITNRKGGQVYPLVDSRLKLVVVDHGDPKLPMLRTLLAIPRADLVFALDDSRTTLVLSLVAGADEKQDGFKGSAASMRRAASLNGKAFGPGSQRSSSLSTGRGGSTPGRQA